MRAYAALDAYISREIYVQALQIASQRQILSRNDVYHEPVDILSQDLQRPIARGMTLIENHNISRNGKTVLNGIEITKQRVLLRVHDILTPLAIPSIYRGQRTKNSNSLLEVLMESMATHSQPLLVAAIATIRRSDQVPPEPVSAETLQNLYTMDSRTSSAPMPAGDSNISWLSEQDDCPTCCKTHFNHWILRSYFRLILTRNHRK
ncbi:hypothetical protein V1504DRAFT_64736 [Lipomyces starkeyi]